MAAPATRHDDTIWRRLRRWISDLFAPAETEQLNSTPPVASAPPAQESARPEDLWPGSEYIENVERAKVRVEEVLERGFERNLREPVRVKGLHLDGLEFFSPDTDWELHPSMNVLLGRNGYGKSLVLRTLAGMLQRNENVTGALFDGARPDARVALGLVRSGHPEKLERDAEVFLAESVGKVPLLAIPDSRFTDRSTTSVTPPASLDLATDGATHFLNQLPYQAAVDFLLGGLALDYWEHGETFDLPTFKLLDRVVQRLSGRPFGFDRINRVSRTGFEIWVRTEGLERPLLIQQASQGTLSVVTIFGLIQSFLQDVAAAGGTATRHDATEIRNQEAIVLIDEVDAHLHPVWQQKVRNLLSDTFPNVQFILSAHSPLIVAGCGPREVSVLRKGSDGFSIQQLDEDFVGASTQELYTKVFDVEDLDEVFLEYARREATEPDDERSKDNERIDDLYARREKGELSREEQLELERLVRDQGRIGQVARVRERRRGEKDRIRQLEREVARLESQLDPPKSDRPAGPRHGRTS